MQDTTTLRVSSSLLKYAKAKAAVDEKSLTQIVEELLNHWLASDARFTEMIKAEGDRSPRAVDIGFPTAAASLANMATTVATETYPLADNHPQGKP